MSGAVLVHLPVTAARQQIAFMTYLAAQVARSGRKSLLVVPDDDPDFDALSAHEAQWMRCAAEYDIPFVRQAGLAQVLDVAADVAAVVPKDASALAEFVHDGAKYGRLARGFVHWRHKIASAEVVLEQHRDTMRRRIVRMLEWRFLASRLCERLTPAGVAFYSPYDVQAAAGREYQARGIPVTFCAHASFNSVDFRLAMFQRKFSPTHLLQEIATSGEAWKMLPLPDSDIARSIEDNLYRMRGAGALVYSPERSGRTDDLFQKLKLDPNRKTLIAYSSSDDEVHNAQAIAEFGDETYRDATSPFATQVDWLEHLINNVEASDDLQLVIRFHPRLDANKREARRSDTMDGLLARFSQPYRHVRIIWPRDPISSYDLAELADVALTMWSSIGVELSRLGVPTIYAFQTYEIPADEFVWMAKSRETYMDVVRRAAAENANLDRIMRAVRWHLIYCGRTHSVDISDVVPTSDFAEMIPAKDTQGCSDIAEIVTSHVDPLDIYRRSAAQAEGANRQGGNLDAHRFATLRDCLKRAVFEMVFAERARPFFDLVLDPGGASTAPRSADVVLCQVDGPMVTLKHRDRSVTRRSALVARLIRALV